MNFFASLAAIFAFAIVCAGGWFGQKVPISEQWPMFEALRTTAAIIFAVIGAWMAIIYPERLKLSFRASSEKVGRVQAESTGWGQLFTPVVHSTLILGVVLILGLLMPILRHIELPVPVNVMRGISYALLVTLTLWQLWTVLLTLVPADRVKSSLDSAQAHYETMAGVTMLGRSVKKDVDKTSL